jgi:hypothetical protein
LLSITDGSVANQTMLVRVATVNGEVYVCVALLLTPFDASRNCTNKLLPITLYIYTVFVGTDEYPAIVGAYESQRVSNTGRWIKFVVVNVGTVQVYPAPAESVAANRPMFTISSVLVGALALEVAK